MSDRIAEKWLIHYKAKSCNKIINYEDSKAFIAMLGGGHEILSSKVFKDEAKRARLVHRFKATHVVDLKVNKSNSDPSIETEVYALSPFTDDLLQELPETVPLSKKDLTVISYRHPLRSYFKALNLLPNSIASGFGSANVTVSPHNENQAYIYKDQEVNNLPTFLSSITLRNIQHRYQYDTYDVSATTFGSLVMAYIDNVVTWTPIGDPETFNPETVPEDQRLRYRVQGGLLAPLGGIEFSAYTPAGTFGLGLGLGGGIGGMRSSTQRLEWKFHQIYQFYFSYRAFITDRVFFTFWTVNNIADPPLIRDDFFSINSRLFALLGVGYYFSEARTFIRKIM